MEFKRLFPPTIDGTVYVEITHRCNYACKHCYAKCPSNKEMSFSQIKQLAKTLKKNGFKKILLTGGEPLLVSHIKDTINLLSKDFKVILITNGTLIKEKDIDYRKLAGVYVSYDGPSEKEYKLLRGKEGLEKVHKNIKFLRKLGVKVSIGIILTKNNINKIDELVKQAKSLDIEKINLTLVQPFGRALENKHLILKPEEYLKYIPKLSKIKDVHFESLLCFSEQLSNNSKVVKSLTLFDKYLSGCAAGKKFIYINPGGYVTPCGYITADKRLLKQSGNIFKMPLKKIYKTPLFRFFMNRSWESVCGKCSACNYSIICKGGCPFRAFYLKNSLKTPDPWCLNEPEKNHYIDVGVNIKNFQKEEYLVEGI
jgi:radical SAM protein with 4Fe4S-binding SPASM domain